MKTINRIKKLIIALFVLFAVFAITSSVLGVSTNGRAVPDPHAPAYEHLFIDGDTLFCSYHGKRIQTRAQIVGEEWKDAELFYLLDDGGGVLEQSVAYGIWYRNLHGGSLESIQKLIWNSDQFEGTSPMVNPGSKDEPLNSDNLSQRAFQYGSVYYGIYKNLNGDLFKDLTEYEEVKVYVDQDEEFRGQKGTYTVGPYKIKLNLKDEHKTYKKRQYAGQDMVEKASKYLYNEIVSSIKGEGKNVGWTQESKYIEYLGIDGLKFDGDKLKDIEFVDENGKIDFPDITKLDGAEFYIKFHGNSPTEIGTPEFKFDYLSSLDGTFKKWRANDVDKTVLYDYGNYFISAGTLINGWENPPTASFRSTSPVINYTITSHLEAQAQGYDYDFFTDGGEVVLSFLFPVQGVDPILVNEGTEEEPNMVTYYLYTPGTILAAVPDIDPHLYLMPGGDALATGSKDTIVIVIPGISDRVQTFDAINFKVTPNYGHFSFKLKNVKINEWIGGMVWEDSPGAKGYEGSIANGYYDGEDIDKLKPGILVTVYEVEHPGNASGGSVFKSICTDEEGRWKVDKLNPYKDYYVTYSYNGQIFEASTCHPRTGYELSDGQRTGYSQADENDDDREELNYRFLNIKSSPYSYKGLEGWNIGYGIDQQLGGETWLEKYENYLKDMAGAGGYDGYSGIGDKALEKFLRDCEIKATTIPAEGAECLVYPVYDRFILKNVADNPDEEPVSAGGTTTEKQVGGKIYYELYTEQSNQFTDVDFAIHKRETADLALQKDLYKATLIVNGKKQDYYYNKKDLDEDGNWEIGVKASDPLYDGRAKYYRKLRKSEYLYTAKYEYGDENYEDNRDIKDLQVLVTYRIAVKNFGSYDTVVDEIVDYYDDEMYEFDGEIGADDTYKNAEYKEYDSNGNLLYDYVTSYVGKTANDKVRKLSENDTQLVVRKSSRFGNDGSGRSNNTISGSEYSYNTLYISAIGGENSIDGDNPDIDNGIPTYASGSPNVILHPGDMCFAYVTLRVIKDPVSNKVKLDQYLDAKDKYKNGKKNIAEINAYSTYYVQGAKIPTKGGPIGDSNSAWEDVSHRRAGVFDKDSNPGSLRSGDLDSKGDIINQEDDTDKSPNFMLIIDDNDDNVRRYSGNVFEDVRTVDSSGAIVGNGEFNDSDEDSIGDKDKLIKGVKVELVELIQDVDDQGIFRGDYLGEKVWDSEIFAGTFTDKPMGSEEYEIDNDNYWAIVTGQPYDKLKLTGKTGGTYDVVDNGASLSDENVRGALNKAPVTNGYRYYSGIGQEKVILSGVGPVLSIVPRGGLSDGEYTIASLPAGDFIIRFTYGDTTQTVMIDDTQLDENNDLKEGIEEVNDTLLYGKLVDGYDMTYGKNAKSYNGQDYKSTGYQMKLDDSGNVEEQINQKVSYNGVNGYLDYEYQNYSLIDEGNCWVPAKGENEKSTMYYFDIKEHDEHTEHTKLSDAKDVYSYRNKTNNFSTGYDEASGQNYSLVKDNFVNTELLNHRAEVLQSFEKIGTFYNSEAEEASKLLNQLLMIKDLMENTKMVAQTGIINTEIERNVKETETKRTDNGAGDENIEYVIKDINFGLQERPEAQLKLNKEVTNFKLITRNNQTLFNTSQAVNNLIYQPHQGHGIDYQSGFGDYRRLERVTISNNSKQTPELIQASLDDELMKGSKIYVSYRLTVDNVGEIDFLDNKFYYTGVEDNADSIDNVATTSALEVLDYVANALEYRRENQDFAWTVRTYEYVTNSSDIANNASSGNYKYDITDYLFDNMTEDSLNRFKNSKDPSDVRFVNDIVNDKMIVEKDRVNRFYYKNLTTYEQLVTTEHLSEELHPRAYYENHKGTTKADISTTLELFTEITSNNGKDNLVYNNLAEIVSTHNTAGRRMRYSANGNQEMSDQTDINNADPNYLTSVDVVQAKEIDADSAQTIRLTPPTGEDLNYAPIIIALMSAAGLVLLSAIIIKTKIINK